MAGKRDDPFAHIYVGARRLEAVMKSGDKEQIAKLDFGVAPQVRGSITMFEGHA